MWDGKIPTAFTLAEDENTQVKINFLLVEVLRSRKRQLRLLLQIKFQRKNCMDIKIAESGNHDSTLRRTVLCLLQCLDLKLQDHDS